MSHGYKFKMADLGVSCKKCNLKWQNLTTRGRNCNSKWHILISLVEKII